MTYFLILMLVVLAFLAGFVLEKIRVCNVMRNIFSFLMDNDDELSSDFVAGAIFVSNKLKKVV